MKKAFFLDVDGVLKKGNEALDCGQRAIDFLNSKGAVYLLLSNTTGEDSAVAAKISGYIGREITAQRLVTATSPLVEFCAKIPKDTPILAIGAPCFTKTFFQKLGFTAVVYPNELARQFPDTCPQYRFCKSEPSEADGVATKYDGRPIEYLIFHADSTDWYADLQLAVDCLVNHGQMDLSVLGDPAHEVKVLCTNPDIVYSDKPLIPRMTVGSAVIATQALYKQRTGKEFSVQYFGKPYESVFDYAKRRLGGEEAMEFYMIGDSLEADIAGANQNGCVSVLVHTGKTKKGEWTTMPKEMHPQMVFEDVMEAVRSILGE